MRNEVWRFVRSLTGSGYAGKRLGTLLLAALLAALSGCMQVPDHRTGAGDGGKWQSVQDREPAGRKDASDGKKLRIVTTIFPPYDFVKQSGRDEVEVTMLLKPGMESHSYEPTPADILQIMNSDLFLYAGGESDVWVEELLEGNDRAVESYALLDWVDPLEEETAEGMQVKEHGHDHGAYADAEDGGSWVYEGDGSAKQSLHAVHLEETEYDEHVWTSPKNAMVIVEKLCSVMAGKDPSHADFFAENAASYQEKLKELDSAFEAVMEHAVRKTVIFGDRFPLLYFVKTYGLDYYAAFPGCSMETEPSAATIAFLTDQVRKEQIPVIFYLEMSNGKIADAIAEVTGARTMVFYSGHAITAEDLAAGEDYLSLMYRNVEALRTALGQQ